MASPQYPGFDAVTRIRDLGALVYLSAREGGEPRILVAAEGAEGAALLPAIARAHRLVSHPWVPKVLAERADFLVFAGDAVTDLQALSETVVDTKYAITEDGPLAFAFGCWRMLDAAHHLTDPSSGGPLCFGAFAAENILVGKDGSLSIFGFGHPHQTLVRARLFPKLSASFVAPEVAMGASPKPGSDLTAAVLFFHSLLRMGDLQPPVVAALRGEAAPGDEHLPALVLELMANSHAPRPEDRSIPRFLAAFEKLLHALRLAPDESRLRTDLIEMVRRRLEKEGGPSLVVGPEARFVETPSGLVRLERRGPVRRVLWALVEGHDTRPGEAISWEELLEKGWPGEKPQPESGRNRVYVAVAELRNLGLRELLVRRDDGYLLEPRLRVEHRAEPESNA